MKLILLLRWIALRSAFKMKTLIGVITAVDALVSSDIFSNDFKLEYGVQKRFIKLFNS